MGESLTTIIAIFLATILMFIYPLMTISERNDDIAQLGVQTAVVEFTEKVGSVGKITLEEYDDFMQTLAATGNSYDVEMEVKILDENPGKKTTWTAIDKIGENIYYSVYTSQIEEILDETEQYTLKEGDIFSINVKNTNTTISQMLRNFFYTVTSQGTYQISAQHATMVKSNGN